ncbi:OprD family outer membrane porin [Pseudoalteromonas denitrificans]|uniref:Outer membrane porin, OprD family n=1 Tax=Pseudoalteromonas denitrificans DSM 6059 TaxID=1123010 RepID=A0A1I1S3E4_9GAMM|nr:OprD family outer membrane porin [Pseudoalteromonas denitrificans]SFD41055.1 outer membrane porin, OprD family [Pseudoalteromonas denitrificans DSM 6059]
MKFNKLTQVITVTLSLLTINNFAANEDDKSTFFGNLRLGYITADDGDGHSEKGSAFGGKLGYISESWQGLSAAGTLYTSQALFNDENGDFFASDGSSYAILGEAYLNAQFGNTLVKGGRFGFDSPYADTDDIRMVQNTFSGVLFANSDIKNTHLYAAHLNKWSGVDTDKPEEFEKINADDGISTFGIVYEGIESLDLQTWYYNGRHFADLIYVEAMYETKHLTLGAQFSAQSDNTKDNSGPHHWGCTKSRCNCHWHGI